MGDHKSDSAADLPGQVVIRRLVLGLALFLAIFGVTAAAARADSYSWGDGPTTFDNACSGDTDPGACERLEFLEAQLFSVIDLPDLLSHMALNDECILALLRGPTMSDAGWLAADPTNTNLNGCTPYHSGGPSLTKTEMLKGARISGGPVTVKNVTGERLDVNCSTDAMAEPCQGGGGGGSGGEVQIDPTANEVTLSANDRDRMDLSWWGAWAAVGVLLALLVLPRLVGRFRFWAE